MANRSFTRFVEKQLGRFPHFVLCMVLEWVLLIILFLDGFLAFFATDFAKHFDLEIPCWLCTRMNHVLFSSLDLCHDHKNLSEIRNKYEGCHLSFATEKESDCDAYKSLVGILNKDLECFDKDGQKVQLVLKDEGVKQVEKSSTQSCSCSCCGEPLKVKSSFSKGKNSELTKTDSELPQNENGNNAKYQNITLREEVQGPSWTLSTEAEDLNNESPRAPFEFSGIPQTDSPNNSPRWSYGIKKKSPLEKTAFACDSDEGNSQNEVDDAILNNLKRQVLFDRKSLTALSMELDAERSASAVAANSAMAMITRLQEEKAALQMDALQYQRMMEEQVEYDEEALQASNDMILKLEEEVKALETELEIYREKHECLTGADDFKESSPPRLSEGKDSGEKDLNCHQAMSSRADNEGGKLNGSLKDFKMEKTHLLGRIKKMENRTPLAESGIYSLPYSSDSVNIVHSETGNVTDMPHG